MVFETREVFPLPGQTVVWRLVLSFDPHVLEQTLAN